MSVGNASDTYGTEKQYPSWLYPEDGRYVGGPYDDHQSGDRWVADAALAMMDKENWSGLWVTFSAMDKIGHMWGGGQVDTMANYTWDPTSLVTQVHMRVDRRQRRRDARHAHPAAQGQGHLRRHPRHPDGRPRLHVRQGRRLQG